MPRPVKKIHLGDAALTLAQAFGIVVRNRRIELGLLQSELDHEGVMTQGYISAFELGKRQPNLTQIVDLARLLEMTPEELFSETLRLFRKGHPAKKRS